MWRVCGCKNCPTEVEVISFANANTHRSARNPAIPQYSAPGCAKQVPNTQPTANTAPSAPAFVWPVGAQNAGGFGPQLAFSETPLGKIMRGKITPRPGAQPRVNRKSHVRPTRSLGLVNGQPVGEIQGVLDLGPECSKRDYIAKRCRLFQGKRPIQAVGSDYKGPKPGEIRSYLPPDLKWDLDHKFLVLVDPIHKRNYDFAQIAEVDAYHHMAKLATIDVLDSGGL